MKMGRVSRCEAGPRRAALRLPQPNSYAESITVIAGPICVVAVSIGRRVCVPVDEVRLRIAVRVILIRVVRLGVTIRVVLIRVIWLRIRVVSISVSRASLINQRWSRLINHDPVPIWPCDPSPLGEGGDRQNHQHEKREERCSS